MGLTRVSVMRLVAWERGQGEGIMWGSQLGVTWGTWCQVVIWEKSEFGCYCLGRSSGVPQGYLSHPPQESQTPSSRSQEGIHSHR